MTGLNAAAAPLYTDEPDPHFISRLLVLCFLRLVD